MMRCDLAWGFWMQILDWIYLALFWAVGRYVEGRYGALEVGNGGLERVEMV